MSGVKPGARILDATAGNRMIWNKQYRNDNRIIFIDIEAELEFKPDIVMDCTKTDFQNEYFNLIFFDPPFEYGKEAGSSFHTLRNWDDCKKFNEKYGMNQHPRYYGADKFKSKSGLLAFIHKAQIEFYRILKNEGCLFMKWNEVSIPLNLVLPFMKNWQEMIRYEIDDKSQTSGKSQTYWLMFMKKPKTHEQLELV